MKGIRGILDGAKRLAPICLAAILVTTVAERVAFADGLAVPAKVTSLAMEHDALVKAGYLDATLYGADPSGAKDSTAAIQAAVDDAMKYAMTTYLPSGTYKVSDAILGEQQWNLTSCGTETSVGTAHEFVQAPTLVGPGSGARPVLKLVDHAAGFDDAKNPKAVVHFWNNRPGCTDKGCITWMGNSDCEVFSAIRDIDLTLGDNPGAVGIRFASAQYSYLENVSVDATGGYAGVQGIPSTEVVVNISVTGGQYGIIPATGFGSLVGITLKNQVVAGIQIDGYAATTLTGFDIVEETGAIAISNDFFNYQGSADAITDGHIVIKGGTSAAISDPNGHDLYLRNVYISTSNGRLIQSGTNPVIAGSGGDKIDRVAEYSFTDKSPTSQAGLTTTSYNIIDGVKGQGVVKTLELDLKSTPADLVTRHLPGALPWFQDHDVKDATDEGAIGDGVTDSTAAIQKAIAESDYVFLPRGDYVISSTLTLKPNTHLFGVPGSISRIYGPKWDPKGMPAAYIETANTADGATYVGDLYITMSNGLEDSSLSGIEWRAGRSSVMRQVIVTLPWDSAGPFTSHARSLMRVSGHGGGKWYGPQLAQTGHSDLEGDGVFGLLVDHTTTPLTVYGVNPEHQQAGPFVEINGAKNVRFFGLKSEDLSYAIVQSDNVTFAGKTSNNDEQGPNMRVEDSTNVIVPIFHQFAGEGDPNEKIFEEIKAGTIVDSISGGDRLSLFKRGEFDDSPFPKCGDGVCDGAENAANCPQDCKGAASTGSGDAGGSGASAGPGGMNDTGGANGAGGGSNSDQPGAANAGGCGCRVDDSPVSNTGAGLLLALFGMAALRRRARQRPSDSKSWRASSRR